MHSYCLGRRKRSDIVVDIFFSVDTEELASIGIVIKCGHRAFRAKIVLQPDVRQDGQQRGALNSDQATAQTAKTRNDDRGAWGAD